MFLKDKRTGDLVRVEDLNDLFNPFNRVVYGRDQAGEEEQDVTEFAKEELVFPSGECLPRCWRIANYQTSMTVEPERANA